MATLGPSSSSSTATDPSGQLARPASPPAQPPSREVTPLRAVKEEFAPDQPVESRPRVRIPHHQYKLCECEHFRRGKRFHWRHKTDKHCRHHLCRPCCLAAGGPVGGKKCRLRTHRLAFPVRRPRYDSPDARTDGLHWAERLYELHGVHPNVQRPPGVSDGDARMPDGQAAARPDDEDEE